MDKPALINLSLMECRNAKKAVMQGLNDPHRSIRIAAAFNTGLYCDSDVVNSLELFFERNRSFLVFYGVCQIVKPFFPALKKLGRRYSKCYHHDNIKNRKEVFTRAENFKPLL